MTNILSSTLKVGQQSLGNFIMIYFSPYSLDGVTDVSFSLPSLPK